MKNHNLMSRMIAVILSAFILLPMLPTPAFATESEAQTAIQIVFTNDLHGYYQSDPGNEIGFPVLKTVADENGADLILDAGDTFHGQAFATLEQGLGMAELMNAVGYDAVTPGNHDWSYGADRLKELAEIGGFSVLASNVTRTNGDLFFADTPYLVKDVTADDGTELKVGVVGVIDDAFYTSTAPENVADLTFGDEAAAATETAKTLRETEGCDIVVAITHESDPESFVAGTSGIDAVLAGHEHILIDESYPDSEGKSVPVVEAGYYFGAMGVVEIVYNNEADAVAAVDAEILTAADTADVAADAEVSALIDEIEARQADKLDEVVGTVDQDYAYSWEEIRVSEQPIGKLVASAYIDRTGADIAFENAGGIRGGLKTGDVTYRDIISISPYGNVLVTKELTGAEILEILNHSLEISAACDEIYELQKIAVENGEDPYQYSWPDNSGSVIQFGGVSITVGEDGKISSAVLSNGEQLDSGKTYVVATNNYFAGSSEYPALAAAPTVKEYCTCEEALIRYISTNFPADTPEDSLLTYTVADGFDFDDTTTFEDSTAAWAYADTITDHVDNAVDNMKNIFNQKTVSIVDFGAEAHDVFPIVDGTYKKSEADAQAEAELAKKNTKAIYAAIQSVSESGGGTVVVPAVDGKVFYTSAIHLEDNVNLHIEKDAVLKFTTDTSLYQGDLMKEVYGDGVDDQGLTLTRFESVELMNYSPFIYAYGKKNIAITGEGTLDGQASIGDGVHPETMVWHQWKNSRTYANGTKIEAQNAPRTKLFGQGQTNVPVAERQYGESESEDWSGADDGFLRPNFIQPYNCQNVLIEGVTICNSPMWEINPVLCDTVMVEGVNVDSHLHNNDGCDPECTSNMVIRNNTFDVGDDCMAIKSGRNGDGLRIDRASFNIVLEDNVFVDGHGGVTIGSEITAGVKNIFSRNNEMNSDELQAAFRFKTNYIRGGVIENIYYKDDTVKMVEPTRPVVLVDLNYDVAKEVQMMEAMDVDYTAYIPEFKHVLIEGVNVNATNEADKGGKYALQLNGFSVDTIADSCTVPEGTQDCYISDFTIRNSNFTGSEQAFNMNYVDGLTLENVKITGSTTPDSIQNSKNLTFRNCDFTGSAVRRGNFTILENTTIENCTFDRTFSDVGANDWFADAVDVVSDRSLMNGVGNGKFDPAGAMTRAMVVQTLYAKAGYPEVSGEPAFTDVPKTAWYYDAVQWATANGVAAGTGDGKFSPDVTCTREEYAQFLYSDAKKPAVTGSLDNYPDAASVSGWAVSAMTWATQEGIIDGKQSGNSILLAPRDTITRAETAVMLMQYIA